MFILRIALVLFVIALFLPSTPEEKQRASRGVSEAVEQVQTFCVRNAALCENVGSLTAAIMDRMRYGAELFYEAATGRSEPRDAETDSSSRTERGSPRDRHSRGDLERSSHTLRPDDLEPEWRGPDAS